MVGSPRDGGLGIAECGFGISDWRFRIPDWLHFPFSVFRFSSYISVGRRSAAIANPHSAIPNPQSLVFVLVLSLCDVAESLEARVRSKRFQIFVAVGVVADVKARLN